MIPNSKWAYIGFEDKPKSLVRGLVHIIVSHQCGEVIAWSDPSLGSGFDGNTFRGTKIEFLKNFEPIKL